MRRLLLIAKRDYLALVRTKAFLIGLIVAPLLFGGGFLGLALLRAKPDITDRRIAVVDRAGGVADAIIQQAKAKNAAGLFDKATGRQMAPRYLFETPVEDAPDANALRLALSDRVRRGELYAFLEIGADVLHPSAGSSGSQVAYYTNAAGMDEARSWLSGPVNDGIRMARLAKLGIDPRQAREVNASAPLESLGLVTRDEKTGQIREGRKKSDLEGFLVPYILGLMLAMMVMLGASPMLSAVTHDKTQRVVEMLLGAATPLELMGGKVLAATGASLTSSVFYIVGAAFTMQGLGMAGTMPVTIVFWFYAYLLADIIMLCALAASLGALCSTPQEAQSLSILVISPVIIPLFLLVAVIGQPNGILATALSLFPPFTPVLMLVRQAMPVGIPAWQPWVGLIGVLLCTGLTVCAAARLFRVGIMLQGKPPKGAQIIRWALRG